MATTVWKYNDSSWEGFVSGNYGNHDTTNFSTPSKSTDGTGTNSSTLTTISYQFKVLTDGTYLVLHKGGVTIAGVRHNAVTVNGTSANNFTGKEILTISANTTVILAATKSNISNNGAGSTFAYLYMVKM